MYQEVLAHCHDHDVELVVVSKTRTNEAILDIYKQGHRTFGENRVQELITKQTELPKDINWHLIGHLQSNKVKYIAPFIELIHSVDSKKLLLEINKEALKNNRCIDILLQVHVAEEESKFGLSEDAYFELIEDIIENKYLGIKLRGIMGMATFTNDMIQVKSEFRQIKKIFDETLEQNPSLDSFEQISMGMSGDFKEAIEEGSTMVRVGSLVF